MPAAGGGRGRRGMRPAPDVAQAAARERGAQSCAQAPRRCLPRKRRHARHGGRNRCPHGDTPRHARLGGGVSWRECHGLDAGGRGQARAFTAPAPIFPRRSRRGRYDSAPAVPQEKGDEALALAQLFSRCLHVARRACGDHGAVDLVQCRGGVLSSVRVTMGWGSPYCASGGADPRGHPSTLAAEPHPRPATLPQWRCRRRHRVWSTVHAAPGACDVRVADLGATPASRTTPAASTAHAGTAEAARSGVQRAGSVAGLSHSRRRAHPHHVPPNADGRASRCRRREPRIR